MLSNNRSAADAPRDLKLLWTATFCLMVGFGVYSASFFNFATEVIRIQPQQLGVLEAVRELPGFLCIIVTALAVGIAEPLLASLALGLVAVGVAAYAGVNSVSGLLVWSFVWSVGLHTWMPLSSSLVISLAEPDRKGRRLGQTYGVGALGALVGMSAVMLVGYALAYSTWFLIAGASAAVAASTLLTVRRDIGVDDRPALVWKREYRLYYGLTFLEGCRKQVFFTFAIYALTRVYGTPLQTVALLMVVNNVVNLFGAPRLGGLIDRIGERRILVFCYAALIPVFIGYATIRSANVLYVLYCLDNLFYLSTACLTTYLQKIADPRDIAPSLSLGVTLNHAAAVLVPLIGGFLWASLGYPVTFIGGAVIVSISLILAGRLHPAKKAGST